jgi:hypothetical protein
VDAAQLTELRTWATRLEERAGEGELRAAARAIVMLVREVEELQARLVVAEARVAPAPTPRQEPEPPAASEEAPPATEAPLPPHRSGILDRLRRALGFE